MKVLPRTEFGDPILRAKAKRVPLPFLRTKKFSDLKNRMIHTMRQVGGVGLAAPQVGLSLAIAVLETRPTPTRPNLQRRGPIVIVNPKITKFSRGKESDWEGCLSFPEARASVPRPKTVTVEYRNERGERVVEKASGLWARIFQHEIDHLNGVVYLDRVQDTRTVMTLAEFKKRVMKKR